MRPTLIVCSLLALIACAPSEPLAPSADDVRAAIEAQNAKFGEAVRAGDTAAIGTLYSEDAAVLPPNAARVSGRAAITAFWGEALAAGIGSAVLTTEEVAYAGGDTATEVGSALLSAKDGSVADEAKYVVLWKQVDGAWLLHRDIWNSNRPAAPPPAEEAPPAAESSAETPAAG